MTHVGRSRLKENPPYPGCWEKFVNEEISAKEFIEQHNVQMEWLETAEREPIGLPHDGEDFHDPNLIAFLDRLLYLHSLGYRFPDYVIENVKQKIRDSSID